MAEGLTTDGDVLDFVSNGWTFDVGSYPAGPVTDSGFDQLAYIYGDGGFLVPAAIQPPGFRVHLDDGGYALIAREVAAALWRLPAKVNPSL